MHKSKGFFGTKNSCILYYTGMLWQALVLANSEKSSTIRMKFFQTKISQNIKFLQQYLFKKFSLVNSILIPLDKK
jgi:apolipoprotein N-acyltransferase